MLVQLQSNVLLAGTLIGLVVAAAIAVIMRVVLGVTAADHANASEYNELCRQVVALDSRLQTNLNDMSPDAGGSATTAAAILGLTKRTLSRSGPQWVLGDICAQLVGVGRSHHGFSTCTLRRQRRSGSPGGSPGGAVSSPDRDSAAISTDAATKRGTG